MKLCRQRRDLYCHLTSLMKVLDMKEADGFPKWMPDVSFTDVMKKNELTKEALILTAKESSFEFSRKILIAEFIFNNKELKHEEKLKQKTLVGSIVNMDFVRVQQLLELAEYRFALRFPLGWNLLNTLVFYDCSLDFIALSIHLLACANFVDKREVTNGRDSLGFTPLISSILSRNTECIKLLLDMGANVSYDEEREIYLREKYYNNNKDDIQASTPMMYATYLENLNLVELLLKYQPRLYYKLNYEHNYAFFNEFENAVSHGKPDCLQLLISYITSISNGDNSDQKGKVKSFHWGSSQGEEVQRALRDSIFSAIEEGSKDCLQLLLDHCDGINFKRYLSRGHQLTPLEFAAEMGQSECLRLIIEKDPDINLNNYYKSPALVRAAKNGHLECLEILVNQNTSIDLKTKALEEAVAYGHAKCIPVLSEGGVKKLDERVLCGAVEKKYWDCFRLILQNDLCSEIKNGSLYYSHHDLLSLIVKNGNSDHLQLLLKYKPELESNILANSEFLDTVISLDNIDIFAFLLQRCADSNIYERNSRNILLDVVCHGHTAFANLILDEVMKREKISKLIKGIKKISVKEIAENALPYSFPNGKDDILALLFPHCDFLDHVNDYGETILMTAAKNGNVEFVDKLIQKNVNLNFINIDGATAVVFAVNHRHANCLRVMLENGADPNVGLIYGDPPLILAIEHCDIESLKLLIKYKADVNHLTENGDSAMIHLICHGHDLDDEMTQILIEAGGRIDITDLYQYQYSYLLFDDSKKIKDLLQQRLLVEEKQVPNLKDTSVNISGSEEQWKSILVLMENSFFNYNFWIKRNKAKTNTFLLLAVKSKLHPDQFKANGSSMSVLLCALAAMNEGVVSYLVSNLYLTWDDYVSITTNKLSIKHIDDSLLSQKPNVKRLLNNPWRLKYLCLLKISTSLFFNNKAKGKHLTRDEKVETLFIPELFKRVLKFNLKQSGLCPKYWKIIGKCPDKCVEDIMEVTKTLYPTNLNLSQCQTTCKNCYSMGLKPDLLLADDKNDFFVDEYGFDDDYDFDDYDYDFDDYYDNDYYCDPDGYYSP